MNCPCGSEKKYKDCCEQLIKGKIEAVNPEALMRARYSAFATHEVDFIMNTVVVDKQYDETRDSIKEWAEGSDWQKLEILSTSGGTEEDETGKVEFRAHYTAAGVTNIHHEMAEFKKVEDKWFFEDGKIVKEYPSKKIARKINRNDPCPCKSGKKYKQCCG